MIRLIVSALFLCLAGGILALASYTDSDLLTLDTIAPEVELLSPAGGEAWYIGDTHDIVWTASDFSLPANPISLLYSGNSGADYLPIQSLLANTGSFAWLMPSTQSYSSRVRIVVVDGFGSQRTVNSPLFSITYVPPAAPANLSVDISNAVNAVITWDAVTQTIYGTPIIPDGYIVLYNESPYEQDEHFYYFLWNVTSGTSFTHPWVASFRDQMYYRVVAYKDYDGRMAAILSNRAEKQHLRWTDLQARLREADGGAR